MVAVRAGSLNVYRELPVAWVVFVGQSPLKSPPRSLVQRFSAVP
jgi:hypothetical protein